MEKVSPGVVLLRGVVLSVSQLIKDRHGSPGFWEGVIFGGGDVIAILQGNIVIYMMSTLPGSGTAVSFGPLRWARLRKDSVPPLC